MYDFANINKQIILHADGHVGRPELPGLETGTSIGRVLLESALKHLAKWSLHIPYIPFSTFLGLQHR